MIVKDEAPVIARCLASARPLIDHWIVVDTGSSDGTQDIVRDLMVDMPGELIERPWVDFGHNRSEALTLARPYADYTLIIDADDFFQVPPNFEMPRLDADSYLVDIEDTSVRYQRTQLVANAVPWRYVGVLHEFLACEEASSAGHLPIVVKRNHDGARRRNPSTYHNDAAILSEALAKETDTFLVSRYTFYLAQSYRDCGRHQDSLDAYLRRAELGFWQEEVYVSLLQAGRMMEALQRPVDEILAVYRRAMKATSTRVEATHAASKLCRHHRRFAEGHAIAAPCLDRSAPPDGLFVERWIHDYGLRDEFAVNAYWAGHYQDCLDASLRALETGEVPEVARPRFISNMRFALNKLLEQAKAYSSTDVGATNQAQAKPPGLALDAVGEAKEGDNAVRFLSALLSLDENAALIARLLTAEMQDRDRRQESWLDLAEYYHSKLDWENLYWACWNSIRNHFSASAAEGDLATLGFRVFDLGALACYRLGRYDKAIEWGREACRLNPHDARLVTNLAFYEHRSDDLSQIRTLACKYSVLDILEFGINKTGKVISLTKGLEAKSIWTVVSVTIPGHIHCAALWEIAEIVFYGLRDLGCDVAFKTELPRQHSENTIIIGAHLLDQYKCTKIPANYIIYNTEHANSNFLRIPHYVHLLRRCIVWDYSEDGGAPLKLLGIHADYVPLGYVASLTRITKAEEDIDVLFVGSHHPRRGAIMRGLEDRGLTVRHEFGVYGRDRDELISRSKVILNIHAHLPGFFEIVRVSYLLSNQKAVVNERNAGESIDDDLADVLVNVPYEDIITATEKLVHDSEERIKLERKGFKAFCARNEAVILKEGIERAAARRNNISKDGILL